MNSKRYVVVILVHLLMAISSGDARADGGVIRLRETKGPFMVTIFTAADPVRNRPVDVSVMVQSRDSSEAILDAAVKLTFAVPPESAVEPIRPMCGHSEGQTAQFTVPATHKQASNKLLYAVPVKFGAAGNWQLQAEIEHGGETAKLGCRIPIGSPRRQLAGLIPYLALPPIMALFFVINQWLRGRSHAQLGGRAEP